MGVVMEHMGMAMRTRRLRSPFSVISKMSVMAAHLEVENYHYHQETCLAWLGR